MVSDFTKEEVTMENDHHSIHKGELFFTTDIQTSGSAVTYLIRTGAKPVHFRGALACGAKVGYVLYEGATITAVGSNPITIQPFNRLTSNTLLATMYRAPTVGANGTQFQSGQAGFGNNPGQAVTGNVEGYQEYILKANTDYVFIHTPSTSTDMVFKTLMYELTIS